MKHVSQVALVGTGCDESGGRPQAGSSQQKLIRQSSLRRHFLLCLALVIIMCVSATQVAAVPPPGQWDPTYGNEGSSLFFNAGYYDEAASYWWDFGDGHTLSNGDSVDHTYVENGDYGVTVIIRNASGAEIGTESVSYTHLTLPTN